MSDQIEDTDDADYEAFKNHLIEIQSGLFSSGAAYTNLVTVGGYAGAFAIWSFVRTQLSDSVTVWIALLLGISLAFFVFWNVFQMTWLAFDRLSWTSQLEGLGPKEFVAKYTSLEQAQQRHMFGWFMKLWSVVLFITIGTALAAFVLLICSCAYFLFSTYQ